MKKKQSWSPALFAVSTIGFGLLEIITGNFNKGLLPVPQSVPGRTLLVYASGIILILPGMGLFFRKWRVIASYWLGIVWLVYFVFLHLVLLFGDFYNGGEWTAAFEVLILACGSFLVTKNYSDNGTGKFSDSGSLFILTRFGLALALIVFSVLHFNYADYIATLIPAWIPAPLFLAYLIGAGFFLTAVSIALNKLTSLSTGVTGCMFLLWVFILHGPRAVADFHSEPEWTSLFVALASSGSFLLLSRLSYSRRINNQ